MNRSKKSDRGDSVSGASQEALVTAPECRGSNKFLAEGAGVLWDMEEFVDAFASGVVRLAAGEVSPIGPPLPAGLPETEATVLSSGIGLGPTGVDAVARRSGVEMRELLPARALLELKGCVTRDAGGAFLRRMAR